MVTDHATTGGANITAFLIAALGPFFGPYAVIVMAALAGALWPLSTMKVETRMSGAFFLLRIVTAAVFLTSSVAYYIETRFNIPAIEGMAAIAFFIGALGNGWSPVFKGLREGLAALARGIGGSKPE